MKLSKNFTRTLFFIIFSCFFQTILTASAAAAFTSAEPDIIPHYNLRLNNNPTAVNNSVPYVEQLLTEISTRSDIDHNFKKLLEGCEVRANGTIETGRKSLVHFIRRVSSEPEQTNPSHLVIKQISPYEQPENASLQAIFKMFFQKKVPADNNFPVTFPFCTFTLISHTHQPINCTVYERAKTSDAHSLIKQNAALPEELFRVAKLLGSALFRLHDSTRPSQEEFTKIEPEKQEINTARYYGNSTDLTFEKMSAVPMQKSDPLARMILVRCMGDFHPRNVFVNESKVTFIDYTTLARDTMDRNKCSLFTNDVSYFMYCCVYFYGEEFIKGTGIDFLSYYLADYFKEIPQQFHERMLTLVKTGFDFFIEVLTKKFTKNNEPLVNISSKFTEEFANSIIKGVFYRFKLPYNATDAEKLEAINKYSATLKHLKAGFIDSILFETRGILYQLRNRPLGVAPNKN